MIKKIDRIAIVVVALFVGLQALIPGWQIMTDGSVYGYKLPLDGLSSAWPFEGYFVAGLALMVVIGFGSIATAAVNLLKPAAGPMTALLMGLVIIGWIGGELIFLTQTMFMTWIILGSGVALVLLAAPYALPARRSPSPVA